MSSKIPNNSSYASLGSGDSDLSLDAGFVDDFLSKKEGPSRFNPLASKPTSSEALKFKQFLFCGKSVTLDFGKTANWTFRKTYDSVTSPLRRAWQSLPNFCSWGSSKNRAEESGSLASGNEGSDYGSTNDLSNYDDSEHGSVGSQSSIHSASGDGEATPTSAKSFLSQKTDYDHEEVVDIANDFSELEQDDKDHINKLGKDIGKAIKSYNTKPTVLGTERVINAKNALVEYMLLVDEKHPSDFMPWFKQEWSRLNPSS